MLKVLCVFGTRPEAVKMAPVVAELKRRSAQFQCIVCITAQHREMLDDVLDLFTITPDYDLDVMREAQSPAYVAAAVLTKLETVLKEERPDWILVQGDTTTTMAAALAAFYLRVRVGDILPRSLTYDVNVGVRFLSPGIAAQRTRPLVLSRIRARVFTVTVGVRFGF